MYFNPEYQHTSILVQEKQNVHYLLHTKQLDTEQA